MHALLYMNGLKQHATRTYAGPRDHVCFMFFNVCTRPRKYLFTLVDILSPILFSLFEIDDLLINRGVTQLFVVYIFLPVTVRLKCLYCWVINLAM